MTQDPGPDVYLFYIWLRRINPLIWRRVLVRADSPLADLHYIIQIAFSLADFPLLCIRFWDATWDLDVAQASYRPCHPERSEGPMQLFAGARLSALHTAGRFNLLPPLFRFRNKPTNSCLNSSILANN